MWLLSVKSAQTQSVGQTAQMPHPVLIIPSKMKDNPNREAVSEGFNDRKLTGGLECKLYTIPILCEKVLLKISKHLYWPAIVQNK